MSISKQWRNVKENWLLLVIFLVAIVVISGAGNLFGGSYSSFGSLNVMSESMDYAAKGMAVERAYYPGGDGDFAPEILERIILKTSSLSTEVERGTFSQADEKLRNIVKTSDSFLLNENVYKQEHGWKEYFNGYYTIKVPTDKYAAVVSQLKEIGEVASFNENARDVTGTYTDLNVELNAEKERLKRFEAMYSEATDVNDKINLNDRIFNQERTVKYLEDQIKNIDTRVEYSQVTVTINEKRSDYADVALVKFSALVKGIVNSFNSLLKFIFWILPWAIAVWIVSWLYRKFRH